MNQQLALITEEDSDDSNEEYDSLSPEQINLRIKTFRNLCLSNKINMSNAFDIDIIGYFSTWLAKQKSLNSADVESFQEIADYLDASEKVYGLRVDSLGQSTSKLVEEFRSINFKNSISLIENDKNENEPFKSIKTKRPKLMLSTAEKLHRKTTDSDNFVDPSLKQEILNFNFNDLFETNRPSNYLLSFYSNSSLKEEKQKENVDKLEDGKYFISLPDLHDKFNNKTICPGFSEFVTEADENNDAEEFVMEGIEDHFDPEANVFQNSSLDSENDEEPGSSSNNNNPPSIDELVECIDDTKSNYSYFNPQLLAHWKGPNVWKTRAMIKALKSSNPREKKRILSIPKISDDIDDQKNKANINKKRNKKEDDSSVVTWYTLKEIEKKKLIVKKEKETMSSRAMEKWNPFRNIELILKISNHIKHEFKFLKYDHVLPYWWNSKIKNTRKLTNPSPNKQPYIVIKEEPVDDSDDGKVDGGKVDGDKVDGDKVEGDKVDGDKVDDDKVDDGKVDGDKVDDGKVDGDKIDGDKVDGGKIDCGKVDGDKEDGDKVDGGKVDGGNADDGNANDDNADDDNADDGNADDGIVDNHVDNTIPNENDEVGITDNASQEKLIESDESNKLFPDNDLLKDFTLETKMDIAELKKEISAIIDEECIETEKDKEWSEKLLFSDLLKKLKVNDREGISVAVVFVGLLHLTNERGLKLFEERNTDAKEFNDDLSIFKPLNRE